MTVATTLRFDIYLFALSVYFLQFMAIRKRKAKKATQRKTVEELDGERERERARCKMVIHSFEIIHLKMFGEASMIIFSMDTLITQNECKQTATATITKKIGSKVY